MPASSPSAVSIPPLAIVQVLLLSVVLASAALVGRALVLLSHIHDALSLETRFLAYAAGSAGVLLLILACLGLYGVLVYAMAHEPTQRRTLPPATHAATMGRIVTDALHLIIAGVIGGVVAAFWTNALLASPPFAAAVPGPVSYLAVVVVIAAIAAMAAYLPARRAHD
jgi:putative ABC transport system permease protein